jgi:hypothetical protein
MTSGSSAGNFTRRRFQRRTVRTLYPVCDSLASGKKAVTSYLFRQYSSVFVEHEILHCGDVMLYYLIFSRKKVSPFNLDKTRRRLLTIRFDARELRRFLVEFAVEELTRFQQLLSREYPKYATATTDLMAMQAHRCGCYRTCFRLSELTVSSLWNKNCFFVFPAYGCTTHLLDDDLASLSGVALLVNPSTCLLLSQLTLSLFLLVQSRLKLQATSGNRSTSDILNHVHAYIHRVLPSMYEENALHFVYRKAIIHVRRTDGGM